MTTATVLHHLPLWLSNKIQLISESGEFSSCNDDNFGPVSTCRFFDFTLTFQNFILVISSAVFILASLIQLLFLLRLPVVGTTSQKWKPLFYTKAWDLSGLLRLTFAVIQTVLSAAILGLATDDHQLRDALIPSTATPGYTLAFVASAIQIPLTILSRQRLSGGSVILPIYIFATIFTDASRLRTYAVINEVQHTQFFRLCAANLIFKGLAFFAENTTGLPDADSTPDSRASFLSRMTFYWLLKVLWTGFRRPLDMVNLETLGSEFDSESLGKRLQGKWNEQISKAVSKAVKNEQQNINKVQTGPASFDVDGIELDELPSSPTKSKNQSINRAAVEEAASESSSLLLRSCFKAFPFAIMAPAIPALVHIGVQLSLPYLVSRTLAFAESQLSENESQPSAYGWGLVGAYGFTSLIDAFASGQFYWLSDKVQIRMRGALIDILYRKSLRIHLSTANELGGGSIANLMSVDMERFCKVIIPFHFLWTGLLQVAISAYLLYLQLGWSFLASIFSIIICLTIPPIVARGLGPRQRLWSSLTDKRVNLVSSAVNNAKGVKYMAYEKFVAKKLLEAREEEQKAGWSYMCWIISIGAFTNLVKEFTAVSTFTTVFLVDHITGSHRFTINNIITSLTLLSLMEVPLLMMGQQYGSIIAALVSLKRIQVFLGKRERPLISAGNVVSPTDHQEPEEYRRASIGTTPSVGKGQIDLQSLASIDESNIAASFHSASLGWSPKGKAVLVNVSVQIPVDTLTMICGPIGSGKTTFLQALLGEVDVLGGQVRLPLLRDSVAYVAQDGWLQENATIRDNITLQTPFEPELYQTVIYAAALHVDLLQLDKHDDTLAKNLSGGQRQRLALARALYSQCDTYIMDDFTSALDAETAAHVWDALMGPVGLLRNKTVIFATNAVQFLTKASMVIRLQSGKVIEVGKPQDLSEDAREAISRASIDERERANAEAKKAMKYLENTERKDARHEEVEHGKIKWSVYKQWVLAGGIFACLFTLVFGLLFVTACKNGWVVYLQYFARSQDTILGIKEKWAWLGGFIAIILLTMTALPIAEYFSMLICFVRVGRKMHAREVKGVWNAGVKFFEANPPGVIINRFSQDIFVLDWELTMALTNFMFSIFELMFQFLLLIIPVPILIAVLAIVAVAYIAIQKLYAPVSRQLRRLEMATKSPLYSQISETSQASGLATIRALGRQKTFVDINTGRLDRSQQPYFYLQAIRRWLLTSLNLLSLVVNVALITLVVLLKNTKNVAVLGAGLVNATQLALMLNIALVSYTEVEIASVAIERILGFASLEAEEKPLANGKMREILDPKNVIGELEIRDLSITYPEAPKAALRNLNLKTKPGERIGICGRSGSGKSTLLLAIFRMLEPSEGEILLDGKALQTYTAFSLRNSLTIVPQNALVLSATVRENLDPLNDHEDSAVWEALDTCHLLDVVRGFPNGLDTKLDANFNLSAGQRQLFNLTRALLRGRRILVLDEATSSMDYETDAAVQQILRTQFNHCTIFTVAHRIATVRDYDRILVLNNGEMVELDSPNNLMNNPNSTFRALAVEQGVQ
ncbi:hypothetical protein L7F22_019931 [Adiantum nelumboides]|nr:hypothetical protein [Adiantum nelumboides]